MQVADNPSARVLELDALRGVAVIGIVWMNVYIFALPPQAYYNPMAWGGEAPVDQWVWAVSFVFIEDKFRTLFAMLFGAGCAILLDKNDKNKWRAHFARMGVLFAIGLVHATLLASNDVLRAYAMAGLALPFIAHLSARALIAISVGLLVLHVGGGILAFGGALLDWFEGRLNSALVFYAENNFGPEPQSLPFMLEQGSENFGERIERRLDGLGSQISTISSSIPLNLSAMALGMALWKDGMLSAEWRVFRMQRLAAILALVALPVLFFLANWVASNSFPGPLVAMVTLVLSAPFDMALGLAYAALAIALFRSKGWLCQRLASVGRLSLSNYVMTSVVLSAIFASWGLGLFGEVSRSQAFALSFVPILGMFLWSPIWTKRFGQGPFERLWRFLSNLIA